MINGLQNKTHLPFGGRSNRCSALARSGSGGGSSRSEIKRGGWTEQRRARQSALVARWQPWRRATGPRTDAGKARSSANAFKHGLRSRAHLESQRQAREKRREIRRFLSIAAHNIRIARIFLRARSAGFSLDAARGMILESHLSLAGRAIAFDFREPQFSTHLPLAGRSIPPKLRSSEGGSGGGSRRAQGLYDMIGAHRIDGRR
jgi:hypothetical protein